MKKFFLLPLILSLACSASAQIIQINEGPVFTVPCDSVCTTVHASHPDIRKTNTYLVENISYAPVATPGATTLSLTDDHFSSAVPIGFSFCFYEQTYTNAYISDNGHLTFNSLYSGQSASFDTKTALPFYNSTFPDNGIFSPFMDNKPTGGAAITYATLGTAPFRKFVVTWSNMPLFGATCSGGTSTYQVILYETTNRIECHITNKTGCDGDATNYRNFATLGIQSTGASSYAVAPGRNASIWTASNEGWAFRPNGDKAYTITWHMSRVPESAPLPGMGAPPNNTDSLRYCGTYPVTRFVKMSLHCPSAVFWDSVVLDKDFPRPDSLILTYPHCNTSNDGALTILMGSDAGAGPPYTFSVNGSPWSSTTTYTNLAAAPLSISIKDANGCRWDTIFFLPPQYSIDVVVDTVLMAHCPIQDGGAVVHVDSGTGPFTYAWSNGDTDSVLNGVEGNIFYSVTVTDALGCTGTANVYVPDSGKPAIVTAPIRPICGTPTGQISVSVSQGLPPYTYTWTPPVSTGPIATGLVAGNYMVTVTDANGCTSAKQTLLLDSLNILTLPDTIHTTCGLPNGSAQAHILNAVDSPYTFLWSNGQTDSIATGLTGGEYYSVLITSAIGCQRTDTFYVNPSPALIANMYPANANCDSNNGAINVVLSNATGPTTYLWSTGDTTHSISGLAPGVYWLKVQDSIGCVDSNSVTLGDDGVPHLHILTYQPPACFGDSTGIIILDGTSGVAPYKYSIDGENFSTDAVIGNISGGTYTIYIRDANSCPGDTTVTFTQPPQIIISALPSDTLICYTDRTGILDVSATGGFPPYEFAIDEGGFTAESLFTGLGVGAHIVQARDTNNCLVSQEFIMPGPAAPLTVRLDKTDVPCFETVTGSITTLTSGGWDPYTYAWSNGSTESRLSEVSEGNYTVTITDAKGCTTTGDVFVAQKLCCRAVVANAFTPNGDGRNDILTVKKISAVSELDFKIFNRFGNLVFQTSNLNAGWDGTFMGEPAEIGTYFYWLTYKCPFSTETYTLKGDVTLLK